MHRSRRITKRALLSSLGFIAAGIVLLAALVRYREPQYWNQDLSWWVKGASAYRDDLPVLNDLRSPPATNVIQAIRQIGPDSIPYLLRWMRYETPPWRKKVLAWHPKIAALIQPRSYKAVLLGSDQEICRRGVVVAFWCLGPDAAPAIPELAALARNPRFSSDATLCLAGIGRPATNALGHLMDDPSGAVSQNATVAFHTFAISSDPKAVQAMLTARTNRSNWILPDLPVIRRF